MDLNRYGRFLSVPGVPRLFGSMLVGRLPAGMLGLAIILRITESGGSYALAGLVTAAYTVGMGLAAPVVSRLVDRCGQTVVLVPSAIAMLTCSLVLALLPASAPAWLLMVTGALVGAAMPPLASASRTMWPGVVRDPHLLESAYAADATFQELVFIIGPLVVVLVSGPFGASAGIIAAGVLGSTGALGFATAQASRRWRPAVHDGRREHPLRSPGIRVLSLAMFALIAGFAATDVAIIAAARAVAGNGATGVLLAVWSGGSMIGGFVYGARSWRGTPAKRVVLMLSMAAVLTAILTPVHHLVVIGAVMVVAGANCAPALSGIYSTAQSVALPGVVTESYAWLSVGTLLGAAVGAATAGALITAHGAGIGFAFAGLCVMLAALVVGAGRHTLVQPLLTTLEPIAVAQVGS